MDWSEYKNVYSRFLAAMSESRLVATVAGEVLSDFPQNLPSEMREQLLENLGEAQKALSAALEHANAIQEEGDTEKMIRVDVEAMAASTDSNHDKLAHLTFVSFMHSTLNEGGGYPNLERVLLSQQIITLFAHLEAFLTDTVLVICRSQPQLLARDKQIEWREIVKSGSWDSLMELLSHEFANRINQGSLSDRIRKLEKEMHLQIDVDDDARKSLDRDEAVRHLLVHAGGRVDVSFKRRTNCSEELAELIKLNGEMADELAGQLVKLGQAIFNATTLKYESGSSLSAAK